MLIAWMVFSSAAQAQALTTCCDAAGCSDDVTVEACERAGGSWAWCDEEVCESSQERIVQRTTTKHAAEIGMWGAWFQSRFDEPRGYAPLDAFDPVLVDPCMNWAILYDQDPQVCEGGIPENPQNPNGSGSSVDVCDDPEEVACAVCNIKFVLCEATALATSSVAYLLYCHDQWKDCIQDKCGLECDY